MRRIKLKKTFRINIDVPDCYKKNIQEKLYFF